MQAEQRLRGREVLDVVPHAIQQNVIRSVDMPFGKQFPDRVKRGMSRSRGIDDFDFIFAGFMKPLFDKPRPVVSFDIAGI